MLRHDPDNPEWPARDRFVLCKGHAAPIQYAALAHHGYFPLEDLMGLRQIGAQLQGHPDMRRTPGVEVSTGSLGQGLSMCVGICLALRLDGLDDTAQVFGLLSDGDCQEGQTWEAATAAAHFGVPNLTAIVDYNHLQTDGTTEEVMDIGDVRAKFEAFGWDAIEIDGHDMEQVVEALERSRTLRKPAAIVAQTKKGKGVSSMEGRFGFHGKPPSPEQAAVETEATLHRGDSLALLGLSDDRGGLSERAAALQRLDDLLHVMAVDLDRVPAEGLELGPHVADVHDLLGGAVGLQVVVVDDRGQVGDAEVNRGGRRLPGLALLAVAVGQHPEHVGGVGEAVEAQRQADPDAHRQALAERAGGDLDPGGAAHVRMPLELGPDLPQPHQVLEREVAVLGERRVLDGRRVALAEHEPVAGRPFGVVGIVTEHSVVERCHDVRRRER